MATPVRGEVWLCDFGRAAKVRSALVVSAAYGEADRALLTMVPQTTALRGSPYEITVFSSHTRLRRSPPGYYAGSAIDATHMDQAGDPRVIPFCLSQPIPYNRTNVTILTFAMPGAAVLLQGMSGNSLSFALPVLMIGVMYVLVVLPMQRQKKNQQKMLDALKSGDLVVTTGGIVGTITTLEKNTLVIRVKPDNLKLEVSRAAVASVVPPDAPK